MARLSHGHLEPGPGTGVAFIHFFCLAFYDQLHRGPGSMLVDKETFYLIHPRAVWLAVREPRDAIVSGSRAFLVANTMRNHLTSGVERLSRRGLACAA